MKKIITLSCLMLLCSFAGMAQKFALIDMEYILKNIPAYEMTNEQLSQVSRNGKMRWKRFSKKLRICIRIIRAIWYSSPPR